MWNRESAPEEVESLVAMAEARYNNGQLALTGGDEDTARAMCLDADSLLQQAVVIAGRTEPIRALSDDIQRCINAAMRTRYLYELTEPLVRFRGCRTPPRVGGGREYFCHGHRASIGGTLPAGRHPLLCHPTRRRKWFCREGQSLDVDRGPLGHLLPGNRSSPAIRRRPACWRWIATTNCSSTIPGWKGPAVCPRQPSHRCACPIRWRSTWAARTSAMKVRTRFSATTPGS
ncbi:MAG: hypothetical protein R2838_12450 [Caldilineaceae bacterium]